MPQDGAQALLMFFIVPLWLIAGLADWLCHRAGRIEAVGSVRESVLHLLQLAEVGAGMMTALFLQTNALVLVILLLLFVLHEATAVWDVSLAAGTRNVSPTEQHVHAVLEMLPLAALLLLAASHWPQALALVGLGEEPADFSLSWKRPPLPVAYTAVVLAAVPVLAVAPLVEEFLRCRKAAANARRSAA